MGAVHWSEARLLAGALAALAMAAPWFIAAAAEVAGIRIPDSVQVQGGQTLVLNGAGIRTRAIFRVYAMGLFLPRKSTVAAEVIDSPGPKRVSIYMLRNVSANDFSGALRSGIRDNHSEADAKALESRMGELFAIMDEVKEAKQGMSIVLDFMPGTGTVVRIDDQTRGRPIAGDDFFRALLRIWVGNEPASRDLRRALLGES